MQKLDATATDLSLDRRSGAFDPLPARPRLASGHAPALPTAGDVTDAGLLESLRRAASGVSAGALATIIGLVLFTLTAYPLLLTEVPPYQDVPNHLATATVLANPALYPEFVSNGFLKTNAALFAWLHFVGGVVGAKVALKAFVFGVLLANALVIPHFVLSLARSGAGGEADASASRDTEESHKARLLVASLLMWPMVHNWFVSMGMLDFALAVPLSLLTLMRLEQQRARATFANGAVIAGLAFATWYAHVFALMVVHLLVGVHLVVTLVTSLRAKSTRGGHAASAASTATSAREALRGALHEARLLVPLLPTTLLVSYSLYAHITEPQGEWTASSKRLLPAWELVYNLWAEWLYGFTWLSASSVVVAFVLAFYAWKNRARRAGFFSPAAFLVLIVLYVFSPYCATNWFHVNSRFVPFLWLAALVRIPNRVPAALTRTLAAAAAMYFVGMGIDFVRLDAERARFTEGIAAVPEGARLLPLVFTQKETSDNTRNLLHLWGFYVTEKHTSAPLLFAHSRSFPVTYREAPSARFNDLVLERFAPSMGTPTWTCDVLRTAGITAGDCQAVWRERWQQFWIDATPRFDHVLAWDMPPEAEALVPRVYRPVFQNDKLVIYERMDTHVAMADDAR